MTVLHPLPYEALGFDPAPGDIMPVNDTAEQFGTIAKQLDYARSSLESIVNQTGIWEGEASQAFARRVGDLPEYLQMAVDSMTRASSALDQWGSSLESLKSKAQDLERAAREAKQAVEEARNNPAFNLRGQSFDNLEALQRANDALEQAAQALTEAANRLQQILDEAQRLHEQHTEIAERIADLIKAAREIAPDEPNWLSKQLEDLGDWLGDRFNDYVESWERVGQAIGDFLEDNANLIANISDVISDLSTIIGLAGDLPIPIVGEALTAISTGLGVVALAGHGAARLAGGEDVVSNEKLIAGAIGVGAGVIGLIPGVPKSGTEAWIRTMAKATEGGHRIYSLFNFSDHWKPNDEQRERMDHIGNQISGGGTGALATAFENAINDGRAADAAGQDQRDLDRARDRAWTD
jgi:hypothetical protein